MSPIIRSVTYAEVYAILLDLGLPVITRSMKAFFTRIWRVKTPSVSNFVYISILIYSNLRQKNTALNVNGKMPQFFLYMSCNQYVVSFKINTGRLCKH